MGKKLGLERDTLKVESFDVQPAETPSEGTVAANDASVQRSACCPTAVGCPPTQCTCGVNWRAGGNAITYCECCV
ncbi:MAG TPA: hypothetical protein VFQ39_05600 [Longimicrobium sp.]|nr:hypothetical protein [Longimicrobium sp.]